MKIIVSFYGAWISLDYHLGNTLDNHLDFFGGKTSLRIPLISRAMQLSWELESYPRRRNNQKYRIDIKYRFREIYFLSITIIVRVQ